MRFSAVIAAAGSGARAGAGAAKQWRLLGGKPVLRWSVEGLSAAGAETLAVVTGHDEQAHAQAVLEDCANIKLVAGGATRADSVRAGLAALKTQAPEAVVVHDAARPFVGPQHVRALLGALAHADGAVPVLPVADTLKRDQGGVLQTVDRSGLLRVQTPQAFRFGALVDAYAAWASREPPTDDAAAVEHAGGRVVSVPGDPMLFKLTFPEDFVMAEALAGRAHTVRVGQGFDAHRFGPGDGVWLCGVRIAHDQGVIGHSDADVGLHALTDALLGAIGAGDIGQHFPPSDPKWKGAPSHLFVSRAVELVAASGGRVVNADLTIICEAPRIGPHREVMRTRVAELLGVGIDRVSVKATTTEGMGFTGRGEGLAAQAIVAIAGP